MNPSAPNPLPLALTPGDPAGIGPEIVVKALARDSVLRQRVVVVGNAGVLADAAARWGGGLRVRRVDLRETHRATSDDAIQLHPVASDLLQDAELPTHGVVSATGGRLAYDAVVAAAQLSLAGHTCGLATAPISKLALRAAGVSEPGHTEILARLAGLEGSQRYAMMFASERLQVVLATIHLPLADALAALSPDLVFEKLRLTHHAGRWLGQLSPRIAVAGINPHAGEGGLLGHDETRVLLPAITRARAEGWQVSDPLPPDTVFMRARQGEFDVVLAMYHDQGLIPVKLLGLDAAVNVTIGLPFLRSSVDHGTAFDIAGRGVASEANMLHVLRWHLGRVAARDAATGGATIPGL
ncbi:MAG: 4-hydroxythreonine-4-phosphate dehydrogenase PdxA [Burkholderiales bacterium]|nr:4-hydroxythreonine-4-phosphate dehydrogenase PdxA [Burkholderiales bacterium]